MIKFSQVHEDPKIEETFINKIGTNNLNLLLIASGGSTGFYLLNEKINKIDMIDFNSSQITLCKNKLELIKENNLDDLIQIENNGIYEKMFQELKNKKIEEVFNSENLIKNFGESAVKYSNKKSFIDHFKFVIEQLKNKYPENNYWRNQLTFEKKINPIYWNNKSNIINFNSKLNFFESSIHNFLEKTQDTYDLISLSNLTDWMSESLISELLNLIYKRLNSNGFIIIRKLISDNDLHKIIKDTNLFKIIENNLIDSSLLYTELYILQKL